MTIHDLLTVHDRVHILGLEGTYRLYSVSYTLSITNDVRDVVYTVIAEDGSSGCPITLLSPEDILVAFPRVLGLSLSD